jgi:radical SAM protein with 4Fe4S-binding SPASM domain
LSASGVLTAALSRALGRPAELELTVTPDGPRGDIAVPSAGDGVFTVRRAQGRPCLSPDETSHYLYFVLPETFLARAGEDLWVEVEYFGDRFAPFRVQYASRDRSLPHEGLYEPAEQRWRPEAVGLRRFRKALFHLPRFDASRRQNLGASFRVEFRSEVLISRLVVRAEAPSGREAYPAVAPLPELRKMPGRFYPINYLFIEITNACNFKCTWCPDEVMDRRRGFMRKEKVFAVLEEIAAKRSWLGPLYPVKLHQMGEPMLHPDLAEIVAFAEGRGVPIELNTNCGLITEERLDGLYAAGLTSLILSYQTPDPASFKTRKAPRLDFPAYRDQVRLAVARKVATRARTRLEIDIMNTKYADGFRIVSEDEQALAFLRDWIAFCQDLERRHGLPRRDHDLPGLAARAFLDQDENGSRYELLDGVHLIWKRCHSWGNAIDTTGSPQAGAPGATGGPADTYCPAPYDQFVIQWNGDVVSCCTDYEGRTKTANVFVESIEDVWRGRTLRQRRQDMLEGRLLEVCAKCQGLPAAPLSPAP